MRGSSSLLLSMNEVDLGLEELSGGMLVVGGALHELRVHNLSNGGPLGWVLGKKFENQVSEIL